MVSFRRCILALAILALFTGLASAQIQVGPVTGSTSGSLTCTTVASNPTQVRAQGYAELLGDILIQCQGGTQPATGGQVPLANITVALVNTLVTSRVFSGTNLSEALLLIDEPGATGAQIGPGTLLPQVLCASPNGAGANGCVGGLTYAKTSSTGGVGGFGTSSAAFCNTVTGLTCDPNGFGASPNVFQGVVSGNQVIFNGIPILAPVTSGYQRQFRITNIRGNASQFAGISGSFQGITEIQASISVSATGLTGVTQSLVTIGKLYDGLGTPSVRNGANSAGGSSMLGLLQCNTSGLTAGAVLRFPEGFAAAFKTRVSPTTTYSGAGTNSQQNGLGTIIQNVPGAIYNGSESGFVYTVSGGQAGLADFGTRLKATFNNVPTGASLYVSTTNLPLQANGAIGAGAPGNTGNMLNLLNTINTSTNLLAGLVVSETATSSVLGSFIPLQTGTNNVGGTNLFGPLPVDASGTATAVWEILSANPNASETAEFAVFFSYTGNPATNTPPTSPVGTVSFSFAPTFSSVSGSALIPRFVPPSTSTSVISFTLCSTTLLYPFVTATNGIDTGIAIANTTTDPFGTRAQAGTCTLSFYGTAQGTTNTSTTASIASGTVWADLASNLKPGFNGYVIAVCNFQLAHGYALVSDTGLRNWATNYLALVLPSGTNSRNGQNVNYSGVKDGNGTVAVEGTVH